MNKKQKISLMLITAALTCSITACKSKDVTDAKVEQPQVTAEPGPTVPSSAEEAVPTKVAEPTEAMKDKVTYKIEKQTYEKDGIKLEYPKISGLENAELEKQCNEFLEKCALGDLKDYGKEDTKELNYEITTQSSDRISILLPEFINYMKSAHPYQSVYTLNVDLQNGKIATLKDEDDLKTIAKKILDNNNEFFDAKGKLIDDKEWKNAIKSLLKEEYTVESLAEDLGNDYGYYYKEGKLYVCIPVAHVMGDVVFVELQ